MIPEDLLDEVFLKQFKKEQNLLASSQTWY